MAKEISHSNSVSIEGRSKSATKASLELAILDSLIEQTFALKCSRRVN